MAARLFLIKAVFIVLYMIFICRAHLEVRAPPEITEPSSPEETKFETRGGYFAAHCQGKGIPKPRYRWFRVDNGEKELSNNTFTYVNPITGVLNMTELTHREMGTYRCWAENMWGAAVSGVIHLRLSDIQAFEGNQEQIQVSAKAGDSISFSCRGRPQSQPPPVLSWYKGTTTDTQIKVDRRVGFDVSGTLYFSYLSQSDSANYSCGAKNAEVDTIKLGSKTRLMVNAGSTDSHKPAKLMSNLSPVIGKLNEVVKLECFFSGKPEPERIKWWNNKNQPVISGGRFQVDKIHGRELSISSLEEADEGLYRCNGSNTFGGEIGSVFLNVTSKPIWTEPLKSIMAIEGRDVVFTCGTRPAASENPIRKPDWFKNGKPLNQTDGDNHIIISEDGTRLTIRNVSRDRDLMCVQCEVDNEIGQVRGNAYLNVLTPITVTRQPGDIVMMYGQEANLTVTAITDPSQTLQYTWFHENRDLQTSLPPYLFDRDSLEFIFNSSLVSEAEWEKYLGTYECQIWHNYQTVNVTFHLSTYKEGTTVAAPSADVQTAGLWWVAIVLGALLLLAAIVLIIYFVRTNYPKETYLLAKHEEKSNLNPTKELESFDFQRL